MGKPDCYDLLTLRHLNNCTVPPKNKDHSCEEVHVHTAKFLVVEHKTICRIPVSVVLQQ